MTRQHAGKGQTIMGNTDSRLYTLGREAARGLLEISAVYLRPDEPFVWASGIKSPIYCDNRLTRTAPAVRTVIENGICEYVRSSAKDHGRANRIEGKLEKGQKTVVIEDLISTAGSAVETAEALREAGADVLGIASIFTYGMKKGLERLEAAGLANVSLTCFDTVCEEAAACGYISESDIARLKAFRDDPSDESWIKR